MDTESIIEEIPEVLQAVGAAHLAERTTYALSGGEKQRIAIASILACKPEYIVFDEPSSSLDPKGAALLWKIILELKQRNLGVLIVEHDFEALLPIADRILNLSDGILGPSNDKPMTIESLDLRPQYDHLLIVENIGFAYGRRRAVEDVSLTINRGEIVAIMGDNGSGKSTVLGMMSGLLPPLSGRISVSGVPIDNIDRREFGRRVAVVFQNPNHQIFERTVEKDQSLAIDLLDLDSHYQQLSEEALSEAGLSESIGMNPFSLSHGQKRRLNISATCFFEPELYFLDEPFIGQDQEGQGFIIRKMQEVSQRGGAAILVTHNSRIADSVCSRIIFMENGRILLDGPPSTVLDWLTKNGYSEYAINRSADP
jgi:energy-coupling factor transport system ATP-binding protein